MFKGKDVAVPDAGGLLQALDGGTTGGRGRAAAAVEAVVTVEGVEVAVLPEHSRRRGRL